MADATEQMCGEPAEQQNQPMAENARDAETFAALAAKTPSAQPSGKHERWKPMLLQSLNFMLVEQGFRLATQPDLQYRTFHKPFWYDFFRSEEHLDLSHWGDGDNALTNYIGHPMEGAISGDIWIQNDPRARNVRYGSGDYWKSRLRAVAWAALYSLQFEQGPVLSETALGNQGGFYFVPGCGPAPCTKPGKKLKPATVGTGWVDLVVTPTAGLGWILLEDVISAKLMPWLAGDDPSLGWRFLGAVLTPSRSMASFMAGRLPWARTTSERKSVQPATPAGPGHEAGFDEARFETGIHYVILDLPMDSQRCTACRLMNSGMGGVFAYHLSHPVWLDTEMNYFPGSGAKGPALEGLFGVRYGITASRWAAYLRMRPGFIHYQQASSYPNEGKLRALTRFAFDAGTVLEYRTSSRGALRFDLGITFVRYLQGLDPQQPKVGWLSPDYYATQGNFQMAVGYVHRF
jgi:hypothetical protein